MDGRPIESVVVAYDGYEPARRALDRTAEIVRDATVVTVVSVVPQRITSLGPEPLDPAAVDEHAAHLAEARAHLLTRGVAARGVEGYGDPARVILEQAKEARADLVVVGSNDKSLVERIVHGSVSTELVHRADSDVLVVR